MLVSWWAKGKNRFKGRFMGCNFSFPLVNCSTPDRNILQTASKWIKSWLVFMQLLPIYKQLLIHSSMFTDWVIVAHIRKVTQHVWWHDSLQLFKTSSYQFRMRVCQAGWLLLHLLWVIFFRSESILFENFSEQKWRVWKGKMLCFHFWIPFSWTSVVTADGKTQPWQLTGSFLVRTSFTVPHGESGKNWRGQMLSGLGQKQIKQNNLPIIHRSWR